MAQTVTLSNRNKELLSENTWQCFDATDCDRKHLARLWKFFLGTQPDLD